MAPTDRALILLVDDDPESRRLLTIYLHGAGDRTVAAGACGFLAKPLVRDTFLAAVRQAVGEAR